jgi:hypothetical protein
VSIDSLSNAFRTLDPGSGLGHAAAASEFFKQAKKKAYRVKLGTTEYYVLEGDLVLDEVQLAQYALRRDGGESDPIVAEDEADNGKARLLGIARNGKMVRWKPGLALTFYVVKESFPTQQKYELARESVRSAAEAWMSTCGIQFQYVPRLDTDAAARPGGTIFSVMHYDAGGRFIAAAFFPDDPPERRIVLIDPSFYGNTGFDNVGVLRHELGHVLGFRHEHIRSGAPPGCPGEPLYDTIDLTRGYDPKSVMHYFCSGAGSRTLDITELDRQGAQRLYGLPLSMFTFAE